MHHRHDSTVAHVPRNHEWLPMHEQVDGRTASESTSDAGDQCDQQNVAAHRSLVPPPVNILASKIKQALENPIPYEEILSLMRNQAAHIQELERSLECLRGRQMMNITTNFVIIEIMVVMNAVIIGHDVTARSETSERMNDAYHHMLELTFLMEFL